MFAERLEKQIRDQEKQAREVNQSERNEVNPEKKGNGSGYHANRRKQVKKTLTKPEKHQSLSGESMYDIRV